MVIPPIIRNAYDGYVKPYYKVDEFIPTVAKQWEFGPQHIWPAFLRKKMAQCTYSSSSPPSNADLLHSPRQTPFHRRAIRTLFNVVVVQYPIVRNPWAWKEKDAFLCPPKKRNLISSTVYQSVSYNFELKDICKSSCGFKSQTWCTVLVGIVPPVFETYTIGTWILFWDYLLVTVTQIHHFVSPDYS